MNKTELQVKIDQLTLSVEQSNELTKKYEDEITDLKKQLEDLNKPKLTSEQFNKLREAIETGVGQFDFDDQDNYSIDFGIDYNDRINCESFSFDNAYELIEEIYNYVEDLFAETSEDNNQLNQD
jgi:DNA repair ATPase RecN